MTTRKEQQRENKLKGYIRGQGKEKVKAVQKVGANFWRVVYNTICMDCKQALFKKPQMQINEYCKDCREKIHKLAEERGFTIK